MGFFIKSLNRRWSLYIVKENKSAYAMYANVMQIVGYAMGYFANGCKPVQHAPGRIDVQSMFDNIDKPRELTFFSVMDEVFGKR